MDRREKRVTLVTAALIPATGIPVGVALGLSDHVLLGSLFAIALPLAVGQVSWESRRK